MQRATTSPVISPPALVPEPGPPERRRRVGHQPFTRRIAGDIGIAARRHTRSAEQIFGNRKYSQRPGRQYIGIRIG